MKLSLLLSGVTLFAGLAHGHSTVYGLWVNDVFQGDGRNVYIRSPPSNSPVKDVASTAINCNVNNVAVKSSVSAKAGDKITFEWFHDNRDDDIIAESHKGPFVAYIAPASSNGNGAVWTKIYEDGLTNGVWAVDKIIKNHGKVDVKLPASLAAGEYLLRGEIIALHESDTDFTVNSARGAQFYPSCSQLKVTSGGSAVPSQNFNFVGGYKHDGEGILYNLYGGLTTYPIPGPDVWAGSSGSSPVPTTSATAASKPTTTSTPPVAPPATTSTTPIVAPVPATSSTHVAGPSTYTTRVTSTVSVVPTTFITKVSTSTVYVPPAQTGGVPAQCPFPG